MTAAALLDALEPLTHDARMKRMVEIGRQARGDPRVAASLAELESAGWYERFLSLQACHGSRDAGRVLRGLEDGSRLLRGRAARLLTVVGSDEEVVRGLGRLDAGLRLFVLRRLQRAGRQAAIDAFVGELARRKDRAVEVLLPFASSRVVQRHLARGVERGGAQFWKRLARHHPDRALALLGERAAARGADAGLAPLCQAVLPLLTERRPDEALALAALLLRRVPATALPWQALARRRPAGVADVVLAARTAPVERGFFNRLAHRLDRDRLLALARREQVTLDPIMVYWNSRRSPWRWLARLPQALRGALYDVCVGPAPGGVQPVELLRLLPAARRQAEARRHLALPALATQTAARLPYAGLLPREQALPHVEPFLNHPDADLRAAALAALAGTLATDRTQVMAYLTLARARKREQDPVRKAMLAALAALPPAVWQAEHLDTLAGLVRDTLDARDLSQSTNAEMEWLLQGLLGQHTDWAVGQLTIVVRERGTIGYRSLDEVLTDEAARRVGLALLPMLRAWRTRERDQQTLFLAEVLGRRLRVLPEVAELIDGIVRTTRVASLAESGLSLLRRYAPTRLAALVPALLRDDASVIRLQTVVDFLHRHRQDLLTPFLSGAAVRGRFSSGRSRWLLPVNDGFHRWTARQQATFARALTEVADDVDPTREIGSIMLALNRLAALPAVSPAALLQRAADRRPAVRDTALIALARLDGGQGVPTLLESLGDERAGVALYALRRALLGMPEAHALDLLRRVPRERVTVAKEVVRLTGELAGDDAFALLAEIEAHRPHRDVHVALLRAVWEHLERPEAWAMIDRAVASGEPVLMHAVVRIPSDRLSPAAKERLAALLAGLLRHPAAEVRIEVLERCQQAPPDDPGRRLLPAALEALGSRLPDERRSAAAAAVALCAAGEAAALARAVQARRQDRRAVQALVQALAGAASGNPLLAPAVRAVLAALADDPRASSQRLYLAGSTLSAARLMALLVAQDSAGWAIGDVLGAVSAVRQAADRLEPAEATRLERRLGQSASPVLRRLGLEALRHLAARIDWDAARLARLTAYRADSDPLVADPALWTLPDEEAADRT